ncbi:unnamed protein product [Linum trigynum]|uniref:DUF4283 domain-containing protein n=1 Tax=Linum trigynum TaxID=586398 RepID=A0AAV2DFD0_9ROSI
MSEKARERGAAGGEKAKERGAAGGAFVRGAVGVSDRGRVLSSPGSLGCDRRLQAFGSGGGSGGSKEGCSRESWFGCRRVVIQKEEAGKAAWYRMQVEEGSKGWFILLNEGHLSWLQGVLQTAVMRGWQFPSGCVKKCGDRLIHVGKKYVGSRLYLQISEQVMNGRSFKVLVPQSEQGRGWAQLISLLQDFYLFEKRGCRQSDAPDCSPPRQQVLADTTKKTYAEAVKNRGFYGAGRCSIRGKGADRFIDIEDVGVSERCELLGRSLIITFKPTAGECFVRDDAKDFKRWANRHWATDDNFDWHYFDNGKWLLSCPSVQHAVRIRGFNQCSFKNFNILISFWPEEGQKDWYDDSQWILVFGIPLHLKSIDLINLIGRFCGKLLEVDWNHWSADFIRIRVRMIDEPPSTIPVRFAGERFSIRIITAPMSAQKGRPASEADSSGELKRLASCNAPMHPMQGHMLKRPRVNQLVDTPRRADSLSAVGPGQQQLTDNVNYFAGPRRLGRKIWVRKFGPINRPPLGLSRGSACVEEDWALYRPGPTPCVQEVSVNMLRSVYQLLSRPGPRFNPAVDELGWLCSVFIPGVRPANSVAPIRNLCPPFCIISFGLTSPSSRSIYSDDPSVPVPLAITSPPSSFHSQCSDLTSPPSSPGSHFALSSSFGDFDFPSPSCVPDSQARVGSQDDFPFDAATLVATSIELSSLFKIEMEGGADNVVKLIENTAREMHQRKVRQPRSKLEMERHRLGLIEVPVSGDRRSRRRGGDEHAEPV